MALSPNNKLALRNAIADFCSVAESFEWKWSYTQQRPYTGIGLDPGRLHDNDCSSYVALTFNWAMHETNVYVGDPLGYRYSGYGNCHEPSARILTDDLRWVAAGDIEVGQQIWAFDEHSDGGKGVRGAGQGRRYRRATVLSSFLTTKECVRVCLDTGETFVCSDDHPWLTQTRRGVHNWTQARDLLHPRIGKHPTERRLVRPFVPWEAESSYEAGWLSGMFDGEGWVQNRSSRGGRSSTIGAVQNIGPTCDRLIAVATKHGDFVVTKRADGKRVEITSNGRGSLGVAEFLGKIRPQRLIQKFTLEGGCLYSHDAPQVVAVERVGKREIQSIQTSGATYFAEGFAVHNTGTQLQWLKEHGSLAPVNKYLIGDMAIWGHSEYNTTHTAICRKRGTANTAIWSSHGNEGGPQPVKLGYHPHKLIGVYRHPALR